MLFTNLCLFLQVGMLKDKVNRKQKALADKDDIIKIHEVIDIGKLVDECFVKEDGVCETVIKRHKSELSQETFVESHQKLLDERLPHGLIFHITFEEDFRIHELEVKKKNLLSSFYNFFIDIPSFLNYWKRFLSQINIGNTIMDSSFQVNYYKTNHQNLILDDLIQGINLLKLYFFF